MKIALAQINLTIGDFGENLRRIKDALERAASGGAQLCVFSEMAPTGYPPHDLLERSRFIDDNTRLVEGILPHTKGIGVVIGYVRPNPHPVGKPLQNVVGLLYNGEIIHEQPKMLLPTYDVFDEHRYFEPAVETTVVEFAGVKLGLSVCEDIWNVPNFWPQRLYQRDPIDESVRQGAEILINVSASPFTLAKRYTRTEMLIATAKHHKRPIVFVNQVGGNDDLIFDGRSLVLNERGKIIASGPEFAECVVFADLSEDRGDIYPPHSSDEEAAIDGLVMGIRDYARKCGFKTAVLGLSGGIDSAIVAALAVRSLGAENVFGVGMPSRYSSQGSLDDAKQLAKNLGINYQILPIDDHFQSFLDKLEPMFAGQTPDATEENIQARSRGILLMALSNKFGHLLLTTGNKSEMATGYCTLYGDMAGGLAVISDVPKTMVFALCRYLNRKEEVIPQAIIDKPPSAELAPDQKDEDSLPPYEILDRILERLVDRGEHVTQIVDAGYDEATVKSVARLVRINEYKRRQAPPGLKITSKAFGSGRRMPIAQRWTG